MMDRAVISNVMHSRPLVTYTSAGSLKQPAKTVEEITLHLSGIGAGSLRVYYM